MLKGARRLLPVSVPLVASLLMQQNAFAADADQGKAIAERWCSACHVVGPEQKTTSNDQAPPFASIVRKPDFDEGRLALLLLSPHPNMPKLALSRFEVADLVEYMRTLK